MTLKERQAAFCRTDIYPVITPEFCGGRPVPEVLQAVLEGGARIVQLRDKDDPDRWAGLFRAVTRQYHALLIIDDSLETALEVGADGVHLGADDMPVSEARHKAPGLLIGASTRNRRMALSAQAAGASYVNVGPIFPTGTKGGLDRFLGVAAIGKVTTGLKVPFTVMGGIKRDNIDLVLAAGARHVAMVTAITQSEDIVEATRFFIRRIRAATTGDCR